MSCVLNAKQLKTRPAVFQRLTSVAPKEFDTIIKLVTPLWNAAEQTQLNTKKRKRDMTTLKTKSSVFGQFKSYCMGSRS